MGRRRSGLAGFWKMLGGAGRVAERLSLRSGRYRDDRVADNPRASQVQLAAAAAATNAAATNAAATKAAAPQPEPRPRIAEVGQRLRWLPRVPSIYVFFGVGFVCAYVYLTAQDLLGG
ncbi:hypothetical protein FLP10_02175 [Agromyces intestinalis]|uniref:Uncharacterized protein n=1 Tax=Agromyces intestinalis TaxID=2592652 RepID=A0A5C1YB68_9MICO|nr:hypothetical protein [Agromyces intestinalis]QEO13353.1 hypothetical protein FLP10_02175 [Agromyces intestinalis]